MVQIENPNGKSKDKSTDFSTCLWQFDGMTLKDLLSALPEYPGMKIPSNLLALDVTGLTNDSRKVAFGNMFVAIRGHQQDGHLALPAAIQNGAQFLIVEDAGKVPEGFTGFFHVVKNSRAALDYLASRFYQDPSRRLLMFGVTGTNGKTSSTYMFEHICNFCAVPTGVIGTIDHHFKDQTWETSVTTPGPIELQERLKQMREAGAKAVAMEVSSHALSQQRVDSVHFNTVLFTNLTQDHLDYHKNMQNYFLEKQKLFTEILWKSGKVPTFAIINTDDSFGRKMRVAGYAGLWTYGQRKSADFCFRITRSDFSRTEFILNSPFGEFKATIPLCGTHNVYNAVGVIAASASIGIPVAYSLRALSTFAGVPGRLQLVPNSKNIHVFVDYAHTPDALENVLQSICKVRTDSQQQTKIITVFGCGGDRDKTKRPLMAEIAERFSDQVIVTSDNPRTEDPMMIISDILAGLKDKKHFVEPDRKKAIQQALQLARPGDVVLIAGKGHEPYQIIGTTKTHFNDFEIATEIFQ
jgi:UDP-N-acetylmuramoyl-L-alanyl-D-glutamate--2,6-diaminopimelate ligase